MKKIIFSQNEQKEISGIYSGLKFDGKIIGMIGECFRVQVEKSHRNLPIGNTLDGLKNILTFHPNDKNVTYELLYF